VKSNPQLAAQKWATNLSGATQSYTAGVQSVTVAPGQKAAAQQAVYVQRVQERATVWATNVAAVSLQTWQNDTVTKGAPRLASGATAAQPKFQTFLTALLAYEANGLGSLPPRGNLAQNQARMMAWSNYMSNFTKPAGT